MFFDAWYLENKNGRVEDLLCLLRGAREGSITGDVMHGRVVMAVYCITAQCSKYIFVLK